MLFMYCLVFFITFSVTGHICDMQSHTAWANEIDFSNFTKSIKDL